MTPYAYAADADIRCSCMSSRCVIALSDHPMHILPIPIRPPNAHPADLEKAPMNDLSRTFDEVVSIIETARSNAFRKVNEELIA